MNQGTAMPPDNSVTLLNLGKLSKPADTLIKKVSKAVGVLFVPQHIKQVAKAKAEAARIEAQSEIEISDLYRRAARRWIDEEAQRQKNMEGITAKALPQLDENAKPESIEDDWIVNFFDKSRIVSDNEMQDLWSRVLAGEATAPGTYSKRTVNFLSDLEKTEAELFTKLCGFIWEIGDRVTPLVFDHTAKIYTRTGIDFESLAHLESIGLIQYADAGPYQLIDQSDRCLMVYYGRPITLEVPKVKGIAVGRTILTSIGRELVPICGSKPVDGFWEYVMDKWKIYSPKPVSEKKPASASNTMNKPPK